MNEYGYYCRPELVRLLEAIGLDAEYARAEGDYLWRNTETSNGKILDLAGGFGANLFGHYHPELVEEAHRLLHEQVPIMAQGSCRTRATTLAKTLSGKVGDYVVIFTNSGTETVEAAMKHAYLERQQPVFWALRDAFHGKTLGSIQLTPTYGKTFRAVGPQVHLLDPGDPGTWEVQEENAKQIAAAFIEPIQGEGGIKPLPGEFIDWLTGICQEENIPLVVDEIQSGMGRTGSFLASESLGLDPDYVCLSKALGGGLAKIGALLIKRERFQDEFSLIHTSTFAEDDLSCGIALKALEVLERDQLLDRCASLGEQLLQDLQELRDRFPDEIKAVRGKGLMIGVELQDQSDSPSNTLRTFSQQGYMGYLATAYLLNAHQIRVAPTLSQPFTIRIEPSAYIAAQDLSRFVGALASFCKALRALDLDHLTGYQVGRPLKPVQNFNGQRPYKREKPATPRKVAFVGHLISPDHLKLWDSSLTGFSNSQLEKLAGKSAQVLEPTIYDQVNVRSRTGESIHLSFIGLFLTSRQIVHSFQNGDGAWIKGKIENAVALARDEGCQVVGLGGYTSIKTGNGLRVRTKGVALTTGNSLTVGMGLLALKNAAARSGISLPDSRLAIVGATGNIARTYALMMAPLVAEMALIVRVLDSSKIQPLVQELQAINPDISVEVSDNLEILKGSSLIVTASNVADALIYPEHLSDQPIVICDISLPDDVAPSVKTSRDDIIVIKGGVVRLPPQNEEFIIGGIPLEEGHVYACMGETLLMGLEGKTTHGSYGQINPENVEWTLSVAEKHGFTLGRLKKESSY